MASPAGFEELVERMGRQPGKELFSDYGIQLLGPPGMLPTALGPHEVALGYRGLDPVVVQEDPDEEIPIAVDIELTGVAGADSSGQRNRSTSLPLCSAIP